MKKIIFADYDERFTKEAERIKNRNGIVMETRHSDIRQMIGIPNSAFVSPANSLLYFDGGIDYYYGRMFPQLQTTAQEWIKDFPYVIGTKESASMLPVGSAMILPLECCLDNNHYYVIAAPTMETPCDISGTRNPYWAILATLKAVQKFNSFGICKIETLIIPGMGTGVGGIRFADAVDMIDEAITDFFEGKVLEDEAPDEMGIFLANPCNKDLLHS